MAFMLRRAVLLLLAATAAIPTPAQTPIAARPYMGWSSWSLLRDHATEANILAQADALKSNGLDKLGYRYVNVDDGWTDGWGPDALPKPNLTLFPHGMDGLAKSLHDRGLKFGIYLNPGIRDQLYRQNPLIPGTKIHIADITDPTHAGSTRNPGHKDDPKARAFRIDFSRPGAKEYIRAQVRQLAVWGVDFVKLDFVGPGGGDIPSDNREEMRQWHEAIRLTGRPIWLELSNYMALDQAALWRATANGWRIENDIECYGCDRDPARKGNLTEWSKVVERFTDVKPWLRFAGQSPDGSGGWNDLDTLELGNGDHDGITPAERQSMFTFWAITCAPLYLGSDLTRMDPADLALISNPRLIAIDQAGIPAHPVDLPAFRNRKDIQLWAIRNPDGSVVVAIFNLGPESTTIKLPLEDLDSLLDTNLAGSRLAIDQLTGDSIDTTDRTLTLDLPSHASRILRSNP